MEFYEIVPRIFLSVFLGALIGLEREFTQKSAGLRTHILVTLGATIFTIVSMSDFYHGLDSMPFHPTEDNRIVRDPSRVAAQIVAGIGFIGGGAVLRYGATVRGLTTAASLWTMASIGMLVGIGQIRLSLVTTLVTFIVLFTIGKAERQFFRKNIRVFNRLRIQMAVKPEAAPAAQSWVEEHHQGRIVEARTRSNVENDQVELFYIVTLEPRMTKVNEISRNITQLPGVTSSTVKAYFENEDQS